MRLLHTTSMTFKEINFPFRFEYTHIIFVSFPGGTGKLWINQILPKTECYSRKLHKFSQVETSFSIPYKSCVNSI